VRSGYSTAEEHQRRPRPRHRFLVVTEGTSDASIIRKALDIRRPEVADFFYFYDVSKETFPYTGHGGLKGFCRAMVAIGIQNQTIVIFDNDAAGAASAIEVARMSLPENVRALRLPDLPPGTLFATEGPDGPGKAEINGRAAAIETYLDLRHGPSPVIRWGSFEKAVNAYHGALEQKDTYSSHFYQIRPPYKGYDFSGLDLVLDAVLATAIEIAKARVLSIEIVHQESRLPLS
jgi:hypothetical protein